MFKINIHREFPHQLVDCVDFDDDIYIADYTEQTKTDVVKRSVEFFSPAPPTDISFLSVNNPAKLPTSGIIFNGRSFVCGNGNSRTQCEAVLFPTASTTSSWILFCELKYCITPRRNNPNLRKAIKQLYKTWYYYAQYQVCSATNTSYLIASLPTQIEPFPNFSITQAMLRKLKVDRNIVLRLQNSIEIEDDEIILV